MASEGIPVKSDFEIALEDQEKAWSFLWTNCHNSAPPSYQEIYELMEKHYLFLRSMNNLGNPLLHEAAQRCGTAKPLRGFDRILLAAWNLALWRDSFNDPTYLDKYGKMPFQRLYLSCTNLDAMVQSNDSTSTIIEPNENNIRQVIKIFFKQKKKQENQKRDSSPVRSNRLKNSCSNKTPKK